ncbi:hypothetical protein GBA52_015716 [Prunus armeniaca]|nr:hypothetical protein GBA52_015716 [Prunus armeniaca]
MIIIITIFHHPSSIIHSLLGFLISQIFCPPKLGLNQLDLTVPRFRASVPRFRASGSEVGPRSMVDRYYKHQMVKYNSDTHNMPIQLNLARDLNADVKL